MKLTPGQAAPDFTLPDQNGALHSLKDYRGQWVLVYFYPKDDTPGCTKEACHLRDNFPQFKKMKVHIFGISPDSVMSHAKFAQKFNLSFTLLADDKKEIVRAYEVWGPKEFMGRAYIGTIRTSFLINPEGKIAKIYEGVKPGIHAEEVLKDLKKLL